MSASLLPLPHCKGDISAVFTFSKKFHSRQGFTVWTPLARLGLTLQKHRRRSSWHPSPHRDFCGARLAPEPGCPSLPLSERLCPLNSPFLDSSPLPPRRKTNYEAVCVPSRSSESAQVPGAALRSRWLTKVRSRKGPCLPQRSSGAGSSDTMRFPPSPSRRKGYSWSFGQRWDAQMKR